LPREDELVSLRPPTPEQRPHVLRGIGLGPPRLRRRRPVLDRRARELERELRRHSASARVRQRYGADARRAVDVDGGEVPRHRASVPPEDALAAVHELEPEPPASIPP